MAQGRAPPAYAARYESPCNASDGEDATRPQKRAASPPMGGRPACLQKAGIRHDYGPFFRGRLSGGAIVRSRSRARNSSPVVNPQHCRTARQRKRPTKLMAAAILAPVVEGHRRPADRQARKRRQRRKMGGREGSRRCPHRRGATTGGAKRSEAILSAAMRRKEVSNGYSLSSFQVYPQLAK